MQDTLGSGNSWAGRGLDWIDHAGDPLLLFQQQRRGGTRSPGLLLLAAILKDANSCLAPGAVVDRRTRAEATAWFKGEIESAPLCSFKEVCAVLDLDEDLIRAAVLGARRNAWRR